MLAGIEPLVRRDVPNILLSHNPNSFPRAAELGVEPPFAGMAALPDGGMAIGSYASGRVRFVDGAGAPGDEIDVRRNRRVRAIAIVLIGLDFSVDVKGDRVDARLQKYEAPVIQDKLDLIGRLLIFTRQMDMLMANERSVEFVAKCFLDGDYHCDLTAGP